MRFSIKLSFVPLFVFLFTLNSCSKDEEIEKISPDYLIFGHYYGLCVGEKCVEIYRLESDRLLEDTSDNYPGSKDYYIGNYKALPEEKFNQVKDLLNKVPEELINETDTIIGQPDAGDWGGFYIEFRLNGTRKFYLIDKMKSNLPEYLHDFTDELNYKMQQLIN